MPLLPLVIPFLCLEAYSYNSLLKVLKHVQETLSPPVEGAEVQPERAQRGRGSYHDRNDRRSSYHDFGVTGMTTAQGGFGLSSSSDNSDDDEDSGGAMRTPHAG